MSDTRESQGTSGWVIFASVMLVVGSLSHISTGLTFVLNTRWALEMTEFSSESSVKILGWINLAIAALILLSAWGVLSARTWARAVGVIFGVLTIVNGITNLQLNAFWGLAGIAIGATIVYALMAKGTVVAEDQVPMGDEGGPMIGDFPAERFEEEEKRSEDY